MLLGGIGIGLVSKTLPHHRDVGWPFFLVFGCSLDSPIWTRLAVNLVQIYHNRLLVKPEYPAGGALSKTITASIERTILRVLRGCDRIVPQLCF